MSKLTVLVATVLSLGLAADASHAQTATPEQRAAFKEKLKSMTPEERAAAKEKAKAKWDAMTPEEQAAAKKRFAEKRPGLAARMAERQASAPSSPK